MHLLYLSGAQAATEAAVQSVGQADESTLYLVITAVVAVLMLILAVTTLVTRHTVSRTNAEQSADIKVILGDVSAIKKTVTRISERQNNADVAIARLEGKAEST